MNFRYNGTTDNEQIEPLKMHLHGFKLMAGVRFLKGDCLLIDIVVDKIYKRQSLK